MKKHLPIMFLLSLLCIAGYSTQNKYLWATATTGGAQGFGTIVQGNPDGTNFHLVYSYDSVNGSYPVGKIAMADNGKLYIATELGGYEGSCTLGSFDPVTNTLTKIHDFMLDPQYGEEPVAGLVKAVNGKIYGIAAGGGLSGVGVIFSIDPTVDSYTDVYDFGDSSGGSMPYSELLPASDGKLYGITQPGMDSAQVSYNGGVLFSFDPGNNKYSILYHFPLGFGSFNYATPIQASNGKIYSIVSNTTYDSTIIFSYDLTSTSGSLLYMINAATNGYMQGGLVQASNDKLYGTIPGNQGVAEIFSYDITSGSFNSVALLNAQTGYQAQRNPGKTDDGKIVFSTTDGGTNSLGALVSFDIATSTFTTLFSFDNVTGAEPSCDILEATEHTSTVITGPPVETFSLYPNPACNILYLNNTQVNTPYALIDILGQELIKGITTGTTVAIDISGLPAGVYFINQLKFVKQ